MTAQGPELRALADTLREKADRGLSNTCIPTGVVWNIIAALERAAAAEGGTYRVGDHYGMHVYEGERWVASFVDPAEAARFVAAVNGAEGEKAEAWAEGRESLAVDMARPASDETGLRPSTPNPYRSAS